MMKANLNHFFNSASIAHPTIFIVMKKFFTLFTLCMLTASLSFGQSSERSSQKKHTINHVAIHKVGDVTTQVGVGLIPTYYKHGGTTNVQPVSLNIGYRVAKHVSLNLYTGYASYTSSEVEYGDGSAYIYDNQSLIMGLRGEIHAARTDNFDIYGGLMAVYTHPFVEQTQTKTADGSVPNQGSSRIQPTSSPYPVAPPKGNFLPGGFVGASWYFNNHWSVFGEIGYGVSILSVGAGYKF